LTLTLVEQLEAIGFLNFFTRRIGPCFQCEEVKQTFYNIEVKRWYCEKCWYDVDFITELSLYASRRNNMSLSPEMQALVARLEAAESELAKVNASRTANVFVGTTDNLTLKHRSLNPKAWGVPTKSQNGQGYFRCSDFPFNFDIDPNGQGIRVYTLIPADKKQQDLFRERFIMQQLVVAKRRTPKEDDNSANATAKAFSTPAATVAPTPVASTTSTSRSFAQLQPSEQAMFVKKAQELFSIPGLFKNLQEALQSVLQPANVTLP
jgi:hypothetical protein